MSTNNKISTVRLLFDECNKQYPDLNKIDQYINKCRYNNNNKNEEDNINSQFQNNFLWNTKRTILYTACHFGHYKIVERLLANDSRNTKLNNKNLFVRSYNYFLCHNNNNIKFPIIDIDVNAINYDSYERTALNYACELNNHSLTVRALLQHPNIEVNQVDRFGSASLHIACNYNRKLNVIKLLKHPNIQ